MKRISLFFLLPAMLCLLSTAFAQTEKPEKVLLHLTPKPEQSTKLRMTTEMEMELRFEGDLPPELAAMNPMKMQMKSVTAFTQKTGALDKQGRFEMELIYDDVSSEMMMNGNPVPLGTETVKLIGKKVKVTMDQKGGIFDVQSPAELQMDAATFKELLKSLYGALPTEPLAIEDTATVPLSLALPLPLPGAGPLNLQGSSKVKLLAVEKDGAQRIAKLDSTMEARVNSVVDFPGQTGPTKMKLDFSMTGGGPSAVNLDKATVKANETSMKLEGKISPAEAADAKLPTIALKGTVKTTVSGSN
ncbi:MAG TPA: hypothetical protein PLD20_10885 [Blastocatellia bacterium]|nr:hypothetical protein [Blastocatellia bacterium]HMX27222.1 hypothetical protein [Blastocatellia bacterium]HMY71735.1 hypothetical protein [Blastocatellia bacterium]HMZ18426.1 hypothetical protein [Blastocatellia bacterium]HNG32647.1 hypothetical protein [Blastocatellia bacterium]